MSEVAKQGFDALRGSVEGAAPMTTTEALQIIWKALKRPPIVITHDERKYYHELVARVAIRHGVTAMQIMGKGKSKRVATARQEAYCVLRRVTGMSSPKLGKYFGRCHDTILRGIEAHDRRAAELSQRMQSYPRNSHGTTGCGGDSGEKVRSFISAK